MADHRHSAAYTLKTRVLSGSASREETRRAASRHDRVTSPARLREGDEQARQWSPDHHAHLAHLRAVREGRHVTSPDTIAALEELGRAYEQQKAQAAQDWVWQRSYIIASAQAALGQIQLLGSKGAAWRGLGSWYGLQPWYGCQRRDQLGPQADVVPPLKV